MPCSCRTIDVSYIPSYNLPFVQIPGIGVRKASEPVACGWDYEASWTIALGRGSPSPLDVTPAAAPSLTCATVTRPSVSFVADPVLVLPSELPERAATDGVWYMFFEMKNLATMLGEIGVAVSNDAGATWTHVGTALTEPFHLSYPFVVHEPRHHAILMIPETNQANEVRVYRTSSSQFPLGWVHVHTPLQGRRYVDTAAVRHGTRWWIVTTHDYSLYLFSADDLLNDWVEHVASPVVVSSRYHGRSGGPPFVFNDVVYRVAQDCSHFYGEQVHTFRIDTLTEGEYSETLVRSLRPGGPGTWNAERAHHIDTHALGDGQGYVVAFDGDAHPDDYQYYQREGWWYYTKRVCLAVLSVLLLVHVMRVHTHADGIRGASTAIRDHVAGLASPVLSTGLALTRRVAEDVRLAKWRALAAILVALLLTLLMHAHPSLIDVRSTCRDYHTGPTLPTQPSYVHGLPHDFIIVTASSAYYFDRLENFIGSVHVWEPGQKVLVYDLGLTRDQLRQMTCWEDVDVVPFNFSAYPNHVRNLFNYAWKTVVIDEVLRKHGAVLALDAGIELRQPLTRVKRIMQVGQRGRVRVRVCVCVCVCVCVSSCANPSLASSASCRLVSEGVCVCVRVCVCIPRGYFRNA